MLILLNKETNKLNSPLEDKFGLLVSETGSITSKKISELLLKKGTNIDMNHIFQEILKNTIFDKLDLL